jgi:hypothetical protein
MAFAARRPCFGVGSSVDNSINIAGCFVDITGIEQVAFVAFNVKAIERSRLAFGEDECFYFMFAFKQFAYYVAAEKSVGTGY